MTSFTPQLQLETLFVLDEKGRIIATREHNLGPGPRFSLIRGSTSCAWAMRADVSDSLAAQIDELAREEPPANDCRREPRHAGRYAALLGGRLDFGPAFTFPDSMAVPDRTVLIDSVALLHKNFHGWSASEIPECSPILAVLEKEHAISVCFCARKSPVAAETGVETAAPFRGRGLGSRVTAAWALAVRSSGRLPLYSTSWSNGSSLAVARKLGLEMCASDWSLSD